MYENGVFEKVDINDGKGRCILGFQYKHNSYYVNNGEAFSYWTNKVFSFHHSMSSKWTTANS